MSKIYQSTELPCYDQVELAEEFRDLTAFMTPLRLMRITTLAQGTTNSVTQFVIIVLKILVLYLRNQAKLFLDNVGVKE